MVEMDVREQQVPNVAKPEPVRGKAVFERGYRRGRAAIEERRPVVGVDEVDADRVSCAAEVKVDWLVERIHGAKKRNCACVEGEFQ